MPLRSSHSAYAKASITGLPTLLVHNLRRLVDPGMIRGSPPEPTPEPVLHSLRRLEGELAVQSPLTVLPLDRPCNVVTLAKSGGYFLTPPPGANLEGNFRFLQPPKKVLPTQAALSFVRLLPQPCVCCGRRRAPKPAAPPPKSITRSSLKTVLPPASPKDSWDIPGLHSWRGRYSIRRVRMGGRGIKGRK